MTTGASWPWNLSTVPTRAPVGQLAPRAPRPGRCTASTTRMSSSRRARALSPKRSVHACRRARRTISSRLASPSPARPASGSPRAPPARSAARRSRRPPERSSALAGVGVQPAVVRDLRDERADRRVHPVRPLEERAQVARASSACSPSSVLERRHLRALGMTALATAARAAADRRAARAAAPRRSPRARRPATSALPRRRRARRPSPPSPRAPTATWCRRSRRTRRRRCSTSPASSSHSAMPSGNAGAPSPSGASARSAPRLATASSRLPITAWLCAVMPTRLPACTSSTISSAPLVVLPEPGGPWMARYDVSNGPAHRDRRRVRSNRSSAARYGPGACEAVLDHVLGEALDRRLRAPSLSIGGAGINACGCAPPSTFGPRLRSIEPATSSSAITSPASLAGRPDRGACRPP